MFKQNNILNSNACIQIIGQQLALGDDLLQQTFIEKHDLLTPLKWVLQTASIKIRNDVLWVLTNLTTTPEAVNLLMKSDTKIVTLVIEEINKVQNHKSSKIKDEAVLVLASILKNSTKSEHIEFMIENNLLDVFHNQLLNGGDHEVFVVIVI